MDENNNVEYNNVHTEVNEPVKKNNGKNKIIIVVVILIIIIVFGIIGFMGFRNFNNKRDAVDKDRQPSENPYGDVTGYEDFKDSVLTKKKDYTIYSYGWYNLYNHHEGDYKYDYKMKTQYVQFNYDTQSIQDLNNKIVSKVESNKKGIFNDLPDECTCVKFGSKYYCSSHITLDNYYVYEEEKYLLLNSVEHGHTYCASGLEIANFTTISKETKNVLTDDEILSIFKYNNDNVKEMFKAYLSGKEFSEEDIKYFLDDMHYFIHQDQLYIQVLNLPGSMNDYYSYDGKSIKAMEAYYTDNNLTLNEFSA